MWVVKCVPSGNLAGILSCRMLYLSLHLQVFSLCAILFYFWQYLAFLLLSWSIRTKSRLRRKGLFNIHFHIEARTGTQSGSEFGGRSWFRSLGGVVLIGLVPMVGIACVFIKPRITSLSMVPPTMNWAFTLINITSLVLWWHFLNWGENPLKRF